MRFKQNADLLRDTANDVDEMGDAFIALCVLTGIASSDVMCCASLGEYPKGENHTEAVRMLRTIDPDAAKHLNTLLSMKTRTEYGESRVTADEVKKAGRAASALLEKARRAHAAAGG